MKLSWPALARRLRKLARAEMRTSRSTWKEYKRNRKRRIQLSSRNPGNAFFLFLIIPAMGLVASAGSTVNILVAIALYSTATSLTRAWQLRNQLLFSGERALFSLLPVSDENYFKFQLRKYIFGWIGPAIGFLVAYGFAAYKANYSIQLIWLVLLAAICQTISSLSVSALALRYAPRLLDWRVRIPLYIAVIFAVKLPAESISYLASATAILPGGWPAAAFGGPALHNQSTALLFFLPSFVLAAFLPVSLSKLRDKLVAELGKLPGEPFIDEDQASDDLHHSALNGDMQLLDGFSQQELNETIAVRQIEKREFLKGIDRESLGWLENLWRRTLNHREDSVANFMLAGSAGYWSPGWMKALWITCAGIVLTIIPGIPLWVLFIPVVIAAMISVPVFGGAWRGFVPNLSAGYLVPMYAAFPIGYRELTRVMLKANFLRIAAWTPLITAASVALAVRFEETPLHGVEIGLKIALTVTLMQIPLVAGRCAAGTNVARDINLHTLIFAFFSLVFGCTFVAAMIVFFAADSGLLAPPAMFLLGSIIWAAYGWMHSRGRLDALTAPANLQ